ncbi:hypothetical protein TVAG_474350 [Trichomonas vaginalis G3]|uniref:Uncharacterized protein n=1 Tax=Trichomonas vaginalis (strain ATCC PRA-98 / G3) TaxID=412133 RepID=A2ESX1_TRIV3|nr:hypothetical protein TVAGG3_0191830 [Trichomonas vaginalis G3]EAY04229.1 hypothetical protein TVAG_474350 [Trichomonas vaginalis G3]KAI5550030.1 hypothetical protein TVAGG3_0191830 [Trichomonas vaginalis G3]|eukprot:XP_001316452.1 hypothetical protein [Trichomonas vaginalis G3]
MSYDDLHEKVMKRINDWKANNFEVKLIMHEYGPVQRDLEWKCPSSFKLPSKDEITHEKRTKARNTISKLYKQITKDDSLLAYQAADAIETKIFNESKNLEIYKSGLARIGKTITFLSPLSEFVDYDHPKIIISDK